MGRMCIGYVQILSHFIEGLGLVSVEGLVGWGAGNNTPHIPREYYNKTFKNQRQRETLEDRKRKVNHHIQEILNKIIR